MPRPSPRSTWCSIPIRRPSRSKRCWGVIRFATCSWPIAICWRSSTEKIRFLSTRRCRHFLASIAPRLLKAIAATPDPDSTLTNLEKVSDSLGGKGVLWELFSFNPPSMTLYVEICSFSELLSGMLISNPGMIDELMDSLVLNKLPSRRDLGKMLAELSRGAEDLDPILHSFKNTQQLYVGVRNILAKEDIQIDARGADEYRRSVPGAHRAGRIRKADGQARHADDRRRPRAGEPCDWTILGMGKLGGRELNFHSDLDVVFLYEADGIDRPRPPPPGRDHEQSAFLQRAGAADHQDRQPA